MSDETKVQDATTPAQEPTQPQEQQAVPPTPSPQERATAILAELQRLGVEKPQAVLETASNYGRVSNQLGDAYRRIQQLEAQRASQARPQGNPKEFESQGGSIDRAAMIATEAERASERATRRVIGELYQAQTRMAHEWGQVQTDEDYGLVKDAWEVAARTPEFAAAIQSGQITIPMAYQKLKERVLKAKMREMADILKQFSTPGQTIPPHIESGQTRSVQPAAAPRAMGPLEHSARGIGSGGVGL